MIFENETELKDRVEELCGRKIYGRPIITEDTTEYMSIHGGMILRLDGQDYFVKGEATEGRFGIDEQPKYWVKYTVDLKTGERKVIKLAFYEDFTSRIGPFLVRGSRSPEKESRILEIIKGHPSFMQGKTVHDKPGNLVRILDFIKGKNLYAHINELPEDHETYYHEILPGIMSKLLKAISAINALEDKGEHHGDIRTDHLIIEKETEKLVWIDYDFEISHADFDLWSLGGLLLYVIGKGDHTFHGVQKKPSQYPGLLRGATFSPGDSMIILSNRITNLKQLFPYIPENLNQFLKNFSMNTEKFYESVDEILDGLKEIFPSET